MFVHFLQFQELVIANKNFPAKCQTIMWVLGQGGVHNLDVGLKGISFCF